MNKKEKHMDMNRVKNPFLIRILNGEDEIKVIRELLEEYFKLGTWEKVAREYGMAGQTISKFLNGYEPLLAEKEPLLYGILMNKYKGKSEDIDIYNIENYATCGKRLTKEVFESLPKRMIYLDFLNFICKYNTGSKSGNDLIEIANSYGIDIVG